MSVGSAGGTLNLMPGWNGSCWAIIHPKIKEILRSWDSSTEVGAVDQSAKDSLYTDDGLGVACAPMEQSLGQSAMF